MHFVINVWWFFVVLEYSLSTVLVFFTFIISGNRNIVQVVQTVQIDLQKFRFPEPGSNLAFVLKNIAHNFYKMQKLKRPSNRILWNNRVNYFVTFLLGFSICLWPLRFGWLLVLSLYKEDYLQIFKCVYFWLHVVAASGRLSSCKPVLRHRYGDRCYSNRPSLVG